MKNETENNKKVESIIKEKILSRILTTFKLGEDVFLRANYCDIETLFEISLPYLKSLPPRKNNDKNFTILYLYQLKKFISLLQNVDNFYLTLNNFSENIIYKYYDKNALILRYGEVVNNLYVILSGNIYILTPRKKSTSLNLNEYSRYIALIILYQELEILKILLKENKSEFSLNLPEFKFIYNYINKKDNGKNKCKSSTKNSKKDLFKVSSQSSLKRYLSKDSKDNDMTEEELLEVKNTNILKNFMKRYLTQAEFVKFCNLKKNTNSNDNYKDIIEPKKYINRLKNYKVESIGDENLIKRLTLLENSQSLHDKNRMLISIYEYSESKIHKTGDIIGLEALNGNDNRLRNTIISADCHLGCLDKNEFNIIRETSEKRKMDKINFLSRIKLFKTINLKDGNEKFINLFSFNKSFLDEYIIKKGELSENLILIKSGTFEVNLNGKISDILNLINYYKNSYKENFADNDFKKLIFDKNILLKIYKLNDNKNKIISLFNSEEKQQISINNIHKIFVLNNISIFGLKETEQKKKEKRTEEESYYSFLDIKCTSIEGEYALLDKNIFYKQIYGSDYKIKDETKSYVKDFTENIITRLINVLYSKIWNLLTKNEMRIYKYIKKSNIEEESKQKENQNLFLDFPIDFEYIKNFNMTQIEFIIDNIFHKYNNNAFVIKKENSDLFSSFENENTVQKGKNKLKFEEEKYDKNKYNLILHHINKIKQKKLEHLNNFRTILEEGKLSILKHFKVNHCFKISQESNKDNSNCNNYKINNYNNYNDMKNNYINNQQENKINLVKKSIISPKNIITKLKRSVSSYGKNKNEFKTLKILNFKKSSLSRTNTSFFSTKNSSFIKSNFEKRLKKSNSALNFKDTIYSSFVSLNKAQIIKLNYSFIKNNENNKNNLSLKILSKSDLIKLGISVRNKSTKNFNNTNNFIFDSTQISQDSYIEKRNSYILKHTRDYFTKNKNLVLHKILKRKEDKSV